MSERMGAAYLAREVGSGIAGSFLALAYCFSYAALIFSGPLAPFVPLGVAMALVACIATTVPVALFSRFTPSVSSPVSHTAAPLAAMTAFMAPALALYAPDEAFILGVGALLATTLLTGAVLLGLGLFRLGRLVRFVPFPVVTGFLAATGWLIVAGAVRIASGGASLLNPAALLEPHIALTLGMSFVWAVVLWVLTAKIKHYAVLPAALAIAGLGAHAVLALASVDPDAAILSGFFFKVDSAVGTMPFAGEILLKVDWLTLLPAAGSMAAVAVMAVISVLLNATGLEAVTGTEADLDRELNVHGAANVLSGLAGGFVAHTSLSNTLLNRSAGGRGRLSALTVGLVALGVLLMGADVMGLVPRFLLCGLLLQLGLKLLLDWGWRSRARLPLREWLIVVAIVVITAVFGFLQGVLVGVLASCVIFALDVSRIGIIRNRESLASLPSLVARPSGEMRVLAEHGTGVQILQLGGFIFFGSAYRLQLDMRDLVSRENVHTLILDFAAVSGMDSSAGEGLDRLFTTLRKAGVEVLIAGASPRIAGTLNLGRPVWENRVFTGLSDALEAAEEDLIRKYPAEAPAVADLKSWLARALGGKKVAAEFAVRLKPAPRDADGFLCRQGDPTDSLLFVERGRVRVLAGLPDEDTACVRVFGPNTILGEIGFFLDAPRTASLRIDSDATVWALGRADYEALSREAPSVAAALLAHIVGVQAERLAFTTRRNLILRERTGQAG